MSSVLAEDCTWFSDGTIFSATALAGPFCHAVNCCAQVVPVPLVVPALEPDDEPEDEEPAAPHPAIAIVVARARAAGRRFMMFRTFTGSIRITASFPPQVRGTSRRSAVPAVTSAIQPWSAIQRAPRQVHRAASYRTGDRNVTDDGPRLGVSPGARSPASRPRPRRSRAVHR